MSTLLRTSLTNRLASIAGTAKRLVKPRTKRGVVSILSMMFLVLFGSLGLAMAIVSQGNLRTASTNLHVLRALGAAETGMGVAKSRIEDAVSRFVVSKGTIDSAFASRLWNGSTTAADGTVQIRGADGYNEFSLPQGIAQAVVNRHMADLNTVAAPGTVIQTQLATAPAGADDTRYALTNWIVTPAMAVEGSAGDANPAAYQITYAPLANGTDIRVFVTGYSSVSAMGSSYSYARNASESGDRSLTRTIVQDFRIVKRPQHAVMGPSRIMIGKNVDIVGNLGATFTDVSFANGDPIVMKSDFFGINSTLDQKLTDLFNGIRQYDQDGDNRLRSNHPTERQGIPPSTRDYDNNGQGDNAFADKTGDGYIDEFDVFMNHYDTNNDGRLVLSARLTAGTPASGGAAEFTADDDLAFMIDSGNPDRNKNGVSGWTDAADNSRIVTVGSLLDSDDRVLGYRDGLIDARDQYAKVRGRLVMRVNQGQWAAQRGGSVSQLLRGSIVPPAGRSAQTYNADSEALPEMNQSTFTNAQGSLTAIADGATFATQVAAQLGISSVALPTYTEAKTNASLPRFFRADMNNASAKALTGQDLWEKMPFNSPTFVDWYIRPRYENMTFKNVKIPAGTNALFVNCTFVGVTHVQVNSANTHELWNLYGSMRWDTTAARPVPISQPLDKSDFVRYTSGNVIDGPANYSDFPDPPVINGATQTGANRDTKRYSNNIRFHNCLVVGSIASDAPTAFTHVRNKLQFTGSTRFTDKHPISTALSLNPDPEDAPEIAKSSLLAPNYSVDIGQFNSPTDASSVTNAPTGQNVQLRGTIVAGTFDARGNTSIDGTLLMTFKPEFGSGPLQQYGQAVGNPANFNVTLGYFGAADGDQEALDPSTLPIVNGERIVGYDLDGDGLPDLGPTQTPTPAQVTAGAVAVPFYGFGRVRVKWNPKLPMPDGIMLPLSATAVPGSYREGKEL
jgi:Tfp pilus assembly protein PilX